MFRYFAIATGVALTFSSLLGGCTTSEMITRRSQLQGSDRPSEINVLTGDSLLYRLQTYTLTDSMLSGEGECIAGGEPHPFHGTLRVSDIEYIQSLETSGIKTLLALGAIGFVGSQVITDLSHPGINLSAGVTLDHYEPTPSGGGGGGGGGGKSCPFIYSWNRTRYVLEAEAYGIAWGKALEMTTVSVLPSLAADRGELNVRLTNERQETHYYKSVTLSAVETSDRAEVVADAANVLWPVYDRVAPVRGTDDEGNDILERIRSRDGLCWESSLHSISPGAGFRDVIEVVLPGRGNHDRGTLLVRARNTDLMSAVLANFCRLLGDDFLIFVRALEHDPDLIAIMKDWIGECSLDLSVWDGRCWRKAGAILPEANAVPFSRAVRLDAGGIAGDSIRVRLSSMADVWKIDAVEIDWTPVEPLVPVNVPLISAAGPQGRDVRDLAPAAAGYLTVLPSEKIDLRYRALACGPGRKLTYALGVRGYLHEWPVGRVESPRSAASVKDDGSGIRSLKLLLRMKDILLPPIYAEWKQMRMKEEAGGTR